ncbi:MAG: hypothetical protein JWL89_514 [Candidatus Saccharibacteria bacterium]|nr:hypothetical protein [Candidatus Saccharibacteria bacterium]
MMSLRKLAVGILSLLLLVSLVGGAQAVSTNMALRHPDKIEGWLDQSKFYDHFIDNALEQAQKSSTTISSTKVTFSDPAIKAAAKSAFTPTMLKQDIGTVLHGNYAWLEGKTPTPEFSVDLTEAKQNFATEAGKSVETYLTGLPVCSVAQLQQLQNELANIDPFALPCRPPNIVPATEAAQVTQQLNSSDDFLNTAVITANSSQLRPNEQSQPYYQKLSKAPQLYQLGTKLPWIYALLALVSLFGIVALASRRKNGVRRVGTVFIISGVLLIAVKLIGDHALSQVEKRAFNQTSSGPLQQSLTDFLHLVEQQIVKVDLWFGIAFLVIGAILLGAALIYRGGPRTPKTPAAGTPQEAPQPRPVQPGPPKRPRLIQ